MLVLFDTPSRGSLRPRPTMTKHLAELVRRLKRPHLRDIPNIISSVRIVATLLVMLPLAIILRVNGPSDPLGWTLFGITLGLALSDCVDGFLARQFEWTSDLGAWLDPLSDKVFTAMCWIVLAILTTGWLMVFVIAVAAATVGREVYITVLRSKVHMPAGVWGKLKTLTQLIGINTLLGVLTPTGGALNFPWTEIAVGSLGGLRGAGVVLGLAVLPGLPAPAAGARHGKP